MKRAVVLWGLVGLLSSCCIVSQVKHPDDRLSPAEQAIDKTVALVRFVDTEKREEVKPDAEHATMRPYCSGVWVSKDVVITAAHCVEDLGRPAPPPDLIIQMLIAALTGAPPPELPEWDPTGQPVYYSVHSDVSDNHNGSKVRGHHDAKVFAFDKKHDLALVKAETSDLDFPIPDHLIADVAPEVRIGEDLQIVGHPVGQWWTYIKGVVSAVRINAKNPDDNVVDAIQVSAPVFFGNSGGGAFNMEGQLVGISSWLKKAPNMSCFIHRDHVENLLKHNHISH
jgi:hypothetical protein